jgi:hypothetical protein
MSVTVSPSPISPSFFMLSAHKSPSNQDPYGSGLHLVGSEKLRKPRWKLDDLPDLTGKVVMVTNPNNKVGKDTAKVNCFLSRPSDPTDNRLNRLSSATMRPFTSLPLTSPRPNKQSPSLKKETGKYPIFLHLDLGDRGNCQSAAQLFLRVSTSNIRSATCQRSFSPCANPSALGRRRSCTQFTIMGSHVSSIRKIHISYACFADSQAHYCSRFKPKEL